MNRSHPRRPLGLPRNPGECGIFSPDKALGEGYTRKEHELGEVMTARKDTSRCCMPSFSGQKLRGRNFAREGNRIGKDFSLNLSHFVARKI